MYKPCGFSKGQSLFLTIDDTLLNSSAQEIQNLVSVFLGG
jgi:hypothetical protein